MRKLLFAAATAWLVSCHPSPSRPTLPKAPGPVATIKKELSGKAYEVEDVGFVAVFMDEKKPIQWSEDMKDTNSLYRDFLAERKRFSLDFRNDSIVRVVDEKKSADALYEIRTDTTGALLDIKLEDSEFSFGDSPMLVTYTYRIQGMEGEKLLLQTPRNYNRQEVVLLMKRKN